MLCCFSGESADPNSGESQLSYTTIITPSSTGIKFHRKQGENSDGTATTANTNPSISKGENSQDFTMSSALGSIGDSYANESEDEEGVDAHGKLKHLQSAAGENGDHTGENDMKRKADEEDAEGEPQEKKIKSEEEDDTTNSEHLNNSSNNGEAETNNCQTNVPNSVMKTNSANTYGEENSIVEMKNSSFLSQTNAASGNDQNQIGTVENAGFEGNTCSVIPGSTSDNIHSDSLSDIQISANWGSFDDDHLEFDHDSEGGGPTLFTAVIRHLVSISRLRRVKSEPVSLLGQTEISISYCNPEAGVEEMPLFADSEMVESYSCVDDTEYQGATEITCDLCDQHFQCHDLLKMHLEFEHCFDTRDQTQDEDRGLNERMCCVICMKNFESSDQYVHRCSDMTAQSWVQVPPTSKCLKVRGSGQGVHAHDCDKQSPVMCRPSCPTPCFLPCAHCHGPSQHCGVLTPHSIHPLSQSSICGYYRIYHFLLLLYIYMALRAHK